MINPYTRTHTPVHTHARTHTHTPVPAHVPRTGVMGSRRPGHGARVTSMAHLWGKVGKTRPLSPLSCLSGCVVAGACWPPPLPPPGHRLSPPQQVASALPGLCLWLCRYRETPPLSAASLFDRTPCLPVVPADAEPARNNPTIPPERHAKADRQIRKMASQPARPKQAGPGRASYIFAARRIPECWPVRRTNKPGAGSRPVLPCRTRPAVGQQRRSIAAHRDKQE